jgi:large repetitive protein
VTDGARSNTKTFALDIVTPLGVTAPTLSTGEVGTALKPATVVAAGGRGPYVWSLVGAPAWLTIDPTSGAIGGTPATAGSFAVQVSAKDVYGASATASTTVVAKGKLTLKPTKLPVTRAGKAFRATLRSTGGVGPLTWKVTSGKFPIGIRLDRKTGVLSGTARKAGVSVLTFTVTDSLGATSKATYSLTVKTSAK